MADEPIVLPHHVEPRVLQSDAAAEHPAPSREQEQLADGVFSPEQEKAIAAVLNLQAGLVLAHHLARETFEVDDDDEDEPRRDPDDDPAS
ncbi:MAG: hypothetical protein U0797_07310 [Gemmataceae bacterium]